MLENLYGGIIKIIIGFSTGILGIIPGIEGSDAYFSSSEFSVHGNQIYLSAQIENQLNPRIDDIIKTGRTVSLKITAECYKAGQKNKPIARTNLINSVKYNLLDKHYEVMHSPGLKINKISDANEMWDNFLTIDNQALFTTKIFRKKTQYFIQIVATLDTELDIGGRSVDLMLFWNNKKPRAVSNTFDNTIFTF